MQERHHVVCDTQHSQRSFISPSSRLVLLLCLLLLTRFSIPVSSWLRLRWCWWVVGPWELCACFPGGIAESRETGVNCKSADDKLFVFRKASRFHSHFVISRFCAATVGAWVCFLPACSSLRACVCVCVAMFFLFAGEATLF